MKVLSEKRIDFLCSILITAVEGGCLQFAFRNYKIQNKDPEDCISPYVMGSVEACDIDREYPKDWKLITHIDIDNALEKFKEEDAAEKLKLHPSYVQQIVGADAILDGGYIYGKLADIIFQVAINGEVIFG